MGCTASTPWRECNVAKMSQIALTVLQVHHRDTETGAGTLHRTGQHTTAYPHHGTDPSTQR